LNGGNRGIGVAYALVHLVRRLGSRQQIAT
jgi:hypothetical protein